MDMMTDKDIKFTKLYEENSERLWRYITAFEYDIDFAKDVFSETISTAYFYFDKLKEDKAFLSWIFTIARRYRIKVRKSEQKRYSQRDVDFDDLAGISATPIDKMGINELFEALDQIPEKQKEAILLSGMYGLSRKEIADIQNTSVFNVKNRIARGRAKVKQILGEDDE